MARTKIRKRKSKGTVSRAVIDAFATAIGGLQKQIQSIERGAPTKEKKIFKGPKKLIPKPPGAAGKSTGYNLQEVMGLSKKTRQYNCYLKSVRALSEAILEPKKTWRQQPMALRVQVVGMAQEKHGFLRKFAYGWPVADMVKQYLVNAKCYAKRLGGECEADQDEDKAGEDDMDEDDEDNEDEDEDEEDKDAEDDEDEDAEDDEDEDEDGEDEEDSDEDEDNEDEDNSNDEDEEKAVPKGKKKNPVMNKVPQKSDSQARPARDDDDTMNVDTKHSGHKKAVLKGKKKNPATNKVPQKSNSQARPTRDDDDTMNVDTKHSGHKKAVPKGKKKNLATNKVPQKSDSQARPTRDDDDTMNVDTKHSGHKKAVPKGKKKNPATNKVPQKSNSQARPTRDNNDTNEYQHPKWQRKFEKASDMNQVDAESCLDGPPSGLPREGKAKRVAGNTLITRCPHGDCTDISLDEPRPRLKYLIRHRRELVAKGAHKTKIAQVNFNICQELSNETRMLRVARANGYPEAIDFAALPGRINKMSDIVKSLVWAAASGDLKYLERNFIFHRLVHDLVRMNIGTDCEDALVNFSALRYSAIPEMIREKSRPGYYGAIGYEVIYGAIVHQVEAMSPNSFYPLSAERLLQFVLIPNVACQLVAEDKCIDLQVAYEDLIHSADVGGALQQLEPDEEVLEDLKSADNATEAETNGVTAEVQNFAATERSVASPVTTHINSQAEAGPSRFKGCHDDEVPEQRGQKTQVKKQATRKSRRIKN